MCLLQSAMEPEPDEPGFVPVTPALPRAFGPYELIKEIGRGGMGVVYAANQAALGRTVAVKLLLSGVYSSEAALRRFRLEAAAAAALQHPNIVAIHDYGEWEGQPYYAMDLMPGRNLADLCDGRPLPARRAAEILRDLAGAVHYAHQKGILHRDLKPSNVLLDEKDQPRITDFGLARRLDGSDGATVTGQMLGSPSYASPEQAAGHHQQIGVASDVYGLGALLYHLLTGRPPFTAATPAETLRLVLDTDPPPPRLLNPTLPRDLETICLKCFAKEPERRYASAAEVAEEMERFLDHRPIRAQPPSAAYLVRKFARRHRVSVIAGATVLLSLVAGLVFALTGFRRAVVQEQIALRQKRTADSARAQAQGLIGFVMKDLQPDMLDHGRLQSQKLTVEAAVGYFDHLPPELRDEATMRDQAAALEALAEVYGRKQGTVTIIAEDIDRARDAAQKALALRRQLAAAHPDNLAAALDVQASEAQMAYNDPATWTRLDQAYPDHIRKLRELEQRVPADPSAQLALARALSDWAYQAKFTFGKPAEARAAATESRERWQRLLAVSPDNRDVRVGYARSLAAMAQTFAGDEQSAQAVAWGEQALAYATQLLESDPTNLRLLPVAAETASLLVWLNQSSAPPRARAAEQTAREHYRMLMTLDPATLEWRVHFARMHDVEVNALANEGRLAEARTLLQDVITVLQTAARARESKHMLATSMGTAASLAFRAGDTAAVKTQLAALDEFARARIFALPQGSWERCAERLFWLVEQGDVLSDLTNWVNLERTAREALAVAEQGLRELPGHANELLIHRAAAQDLLGRALLGQAKPAEAAASFEQAMKGFREAPAGGSLSDRKSRAMELPGRLVFALALMGDLGRALAASENALTQAEEELKQDPDDLGLREVAAKAAEMLCYRAGITPRSREAALIAREHYRVLMDRQATNQHWRLKYANTYIMDRSFLWEDGQFELARETCRRYDALLEPFVVNGGSPPTTEPFPRDVAITTGTQLEGILGQRIVNSYCRAFFAAALGDAAETQTQLEAWRVRKAATYHQLPAGSLERRKRDIEFSLTAAWLEGVAGDWPVFARFARASLDEVEGCLHEQPENSELLFCRTISRGLCGLALLHEGRAEEAAPLLREAISGMRHEPPMPTISGWEGASAFLGDSSTEWLIQTGDVAMARSLLEEAVTGWEKFLAEDPRCWGRRLELARTQVQLAGVLDPTIPADAARRTKLLDQAAVVLAGPEAEGRLTVDAKEARKKLEALRAAAPKSAAQ
jgi:hypothetical protein